MNSASATAVVKPVGEARPHEFTMCSGSDSELAESSDGESSDEGPLWSRAGEHVQHSRNSSRKACGHRPPGVAECSATGNLEVSSLLTPLEQEELSLLRQLAAGYRLSPSTENLVERPRARHMSFSWGSLQWAVHGNPLIASSMFFSQRPVHCCPCLCFFLSVSPLSQPTAKCQFMCPCRVC